MILTYKYRFSLWNYLEVISSRKVKSQLHKKFGTYRKRKESMLIYNGSLRQARRCAHPDGKEK